VPDSLSAGEVIEGYFISLEIMRAASPEYVVKKKFIFVTVEMSGKLNT